MPDREQVDQDLTFLRQVAAPFMGAIDTGIKVLTNAGIKPAATGVIC